MIILEQKNYFMSILKAIQLLDIEGKGNYNDRFKIKA